MHKYVAIVQEGGDKTTATSKIFCHIKHFFPPFSRLVSPITACLWFDGFWVVIT